MIELTFADMVLLSLCALLLIFFVVVDGNECEEVEVMMDLHGNPVDVGDKVYIMAAARGGSKCMRLLYGTVSAINKSKCEVLVHENNRTYNKTSATILKPLE